MTDHECTGHDCTHDMSRRRFLGTFGMGLGGIALSSLVNPRSAAVAAELDQAFGFLDDHLCNLHVAGRRLVKRGTDNLSLRVPLHFGHFFRRQLCAFHHAAARTYRRLIDYFEPRFLLGLTATPERTDGGDLLALCQENLVFRCDLAEGIREGLLSPFHYFGVPDEVDYVVCAVGRASTARAPSWRTC